ncbi:4F2 cell-surface antigen heavy chain-like [Contarinia nasturtii]|uniref:4F2 cell-surface antigen heavy chain-like n=1 Tax=Contarinia nasturtii TaxID=265458 RepID=UPI0012D3E045|nr:4F2 cell-surface antigen heavy chain-like [Contarinia nasturtii]
MNNLEIPTNKTPLLGVDSSQSLNTSPSCSTFLPEEDASTCPLLPNTPSPPPQMNFNDPLTPNILNENCSQPGTDDFVNDNPRAADRAAEEDTSSCSGSSGCIDGQVVAGTTTVFNPNVYQHFGKNDEVIPESETQLHAHLNLPDSKDVPSFVYWNWKLIRKCSFFFFVAGVVAIAATVVSMIYLLPKTCNPKTVWYEGSVFYEIHPTRFPDSNVDGFGDLRGLADRVDYLTKLGVVGVRLNSIFPMKNSPNHFQNITSLFEIDDVLGNHTDMINLIRIFHKNNLSLVLDLPIYPFMTKLDPVTTTIEESTKHPMIIEQGALRVSRAPLETNKLICALKMWIECGVDGFYIKGLENMYEDPLLLPNIRAWKAVIGDNRILMVNNQLLENVKQPLAEEIVRHVDLVDIFIDVTNSTQQIAKQINQHLNGVLKPGNDAAFIQWSIGGVSEHETQKSYELTTNGTLAATLMSLMLPGTPNVYHGDGNNEGKSQQQFSKAIDSQQWHSSPQTNTENGLNNSSRINPDDLDTITRMITLRDISPSIHLNKYKKKDKYESNTSAMYHENGNILILVRWYPRRNTFASISNFGITNITMDLTNFFYSGQIMIGGEAHEKIYFDRFEIGPSKTIVIKIDK